MSAIVQARPVGRVEAPSRGECFAWIGLLALAAVVRAGRVGEPPLDPAEAARALEAWTLWREGRVVYASGPLMTNLLSLVFGLFSAGDGQARLLSVLGGLGTVAASWLLRPGLGRLGAWCAATMLAACPALVVASRTASPAALVACFSVLMTACAFRFAREHDARWLTGAITSGLLGLAADTSFTVVIGSLALALAVAEGDRLARPIWWPAIRRAAPGAIGTALLVAVVVDTRLLMNPNGLGAGLFDPFWAWSGDVVRGGGLVAPIMLLLVDGGAFALAMIGLAGFRRYPRTASLLGTWLLVSTILATLMRQPDLRYLVQPLVPAALLGGIGLGRLLEVLRVRGSARSSVVGLAGLVPLLAAGFQINAGLRSGQDPWASAGSLALVGLLIVGLAAMNWLPRAELGSAAATLSLIVVTLWTITTASRLLEARGGPRAHFLDAAVLTEEIEAVREEARKWLRADPGGTIRVDPSLRPLVAWSLRDVPTVIFDGSAAQSGGPRLLVDPAAGADLRTRRLIVGYAAERRTLDLSPARLWRWVIGRASLVEVRPYAILVVQSAGG